MGYGRKASGGGVSNALCTATAANLLEGAVRYKRVNKQ